MFSHLVENGECEIPLVDPARVEESVLLPRFGAVVELRHLHGVLGEGLVRDLDLVLAHRDRGALALWDRDQVVLSDFIRYFQGQDEPTVKKPL